MLLLFSKAASSGTPNIVASETWTGANNASWGSQWTMTHASGTAGTTTIQGNAGRMTTGASTFGTERAYLSGMNTQTDMDMTVTFTIAAQVDQYLSFGIDTDNVTWSGDPSYTTNGLFGYVSVGLTASTSVLRLQKLVSGTRTQLGSDVTLTITAGVAYKIRVKRSGTTVQTKLWAASGAEPAAWAITATNAGGTPASGKLAISYQGNSTTTPVSVTFDDLSVSDGTFVVVNNLGKVRVYDGSTQAIKPVKIWSGSAWVQKKVRFWTGTAWAYTFDTGTTFTYTFYEDTTDAGTFLGTAELPDGSDPGFFISQTPKLAENAGDPGTFSYTP